jgi:hypothetical protein
LDFIETSARTGQNVKDAFLRVAHEIITRQKNGMLVIPKPPDAPILAGDRQPRECGC